MATLHPFINRAKTGKTTGWRYGIGLFIISRLPIRTNPLGFFTDPSRGFDQKVPLELATSPFKARIVISMK